MAHGDCYSPTSDSRQCSAHIAFFMQAGPRTRAFYFYLADEKPSDGRRLLSGKVMRSFFDGLPAILDKRLFGECCFIDGYVEYVLSFSYFS